MRRREGQEPTQGLERRKTRSHEAAWKLIVLDFSAHDGALDQLDIADALAQILLDVEESVNFDRIGNRHGNTHDELHLHQAADRSLVCRVVAEVGARVHGVGQLDIVVDKDPLPRHEDIVENEQSVGLVEIHRKRMVECRTTAVAVRFPANQFHTRGIEGQTEGAGFARFLVDICRFTRAWRKAMYAGVATGRVTLKARRGLDFGYNTDAHL